ncbi:phosphate/phosphite/phosphonate ABC transporter substrate-binding protein [Nesterenkonia sp.]|uniref:phosphate/phosphite/phosphonate ABC transporter substrate-binding protein n=1 Tax=Nesterenkonia sp. TaxID=704201 RepID=UPI002628281C|nr:phosphate/phosphite/phosphonate ABC transporter substrate-binding protein [Nesterenkonia sp.]
MRRTPKAAFALASVLTVGLVACAGDAEEITGDDDAEDQTEETAENGDGGDAGSEDGGAEITSLDGDPLVIGLVPSQDQEGIVEDAEGIADQLSEALDGYPVEIFVADNYLGVIQGMQSGDVQVLMSGPVGMIQAEEQAGGVPILQAIRYGSDQYVTQWFTNDPDTYCLDEPVAVEQEEAEPFLFCNGIVDEDGNFADYGPMGEEALELIEDGTTVSYVDEGSASGYYFPQTQLNELGIEVDAQFAGGHDQSVLNVYNGQIDIGTSFDDARNNIIEEAPDVGQEVVVFAWAGPIPNDGIVASGDLTEEERQLITDAFISFAGDGNLGEGDPLYDVYEFEGVAPADEAALDVARQVYQSFGDDA